MDILCLHAFILKSWSYIYIEVVIVANVNETTTVKLGDSAKLFFLQFR